MGFLSPILSPFLTPFLPPTVGITHLCTRVRTSWPQITDSVPVMYFSARLKDTVDPVPVTLDHHIAALTGLNVQPLCTEHLQDVHYGIWGHYEPHFDHAVGPRLSPGEETGVFCASPRSWLHAQGSVLAELRGPCRVTGMKASQSHENHAPYLLYRFSSPC